MLLQRNPKTASVVGRSDSPIEVSILQKENKILRFKRSSGQLLTRTISRVMSPLSKCGVHLCPNSYQPCQRQSQPKTNPCTITMKIERFLTIVDRYAIAFGDTRRNIYILQVPADPLTSRNLRAFNNDFGLSVTLPNTNPVVQDRSLRSSSAQTRSYCGRQDHTLPRSISLGSIAELRSSAFTATSQRVFRHSNTPSSTSLDPVAPSKTLRRPTTMSDVDDLASLDQLRESPLFVDMQPGHQANFYFPITENSNATLIRPRSFKSYSYRNVRRRQTTPLLVRSTSIKQGLERTNYQKKIPLFVPSAVLKPQVQSLFPRRVSSLVAADPDAHNDWCDPASDASSITRYSRASGWSIAPQRSYLHLAEEEETQTAAVAQESELLDEMKMEKRSYKDLSKRSYTSYARLLKRKLLLHI